MSDHARPLRRGISILGIVSFATLVLVVQPLAGNAAPNDKSVTIENVPLPVNVQNQSFGVNVQNPSLGVNVQNESLPVTGAVGINPAANTVQLAGTPTVNVAVPQTPRYLDYSLIASENEEVELVSGTMQVSAITLTNRSPNDIGLTVLNAITDQPGCDGAVIGGGEPHLKFELGPRETIHAAFPVPIVFRPLDEASTCLAVIVNDLHGPEVRVGISGFQV